MNKNHNKLTKDEKAEKSLLERYLQTRVVKNGQTPEVRKRSNSLMAMIPLAAASLLSTTLQAQCGQGAFVFDPTGGANGDGILDIDGDGNPDFQFNIGTLAPASNRPTVGLTIIGTVGLGVFFSDPSSGTELLYYGGESVNQGFDIANGGAYGLFFLDVVVPNSFYIIIEDGDGAIGFIEFILEGNGSYAIGPNSGLSTVTTPGNTVVTGDCGSLGVQLPVALASFSAASLDKQVRLSWKTMRESGNEGFAIERSTDGAQWANVGWVAGNGTSAETHSYVFNDDELLANVEYYYRLKQMDFDGSFEYSEVVSGMIKDANLTGISEVFPNPVSSSGSTQLQIQASKADRAQLSLLNAAGQVVQQQQYNLLSGSNTVELPTAGLTAGSYFAKIELNGEVLYKKLVVTD